MATLHEASHQLFSRRPDERFGTLLALWDHCKRERDESHDQWVAPASIQVTPSDGRLGLHISDDAQTLNHWSFGQICRLANVSKDTVNRLTTETAGQVLQETLPTAGKPLQVLTNGSRIRSVHGASYTRLHNVELLALLREFATDFEPPPVGVNGATGLYCGEQDMFCFLIDPGGWTEIDDQAFAPGFFVWNSEVGRRASASRRSGSRPSVRTTSSGMRPTSLNSRASTRPTSVKGWRRSGGASRTWSSVVTVVSRALSRWSRKRCVKRWHQTRSVCSNCSAIEASPVRLPRRLQNSRYRPDVSRSLASSMH